MIYTKSLRIIENIADIYYWCNRLYQKENSGLHLLAFASYNRITYNFVIRSPKCTKEIWRLCKNLHQINCRSEFVNISFNILIHKSFSGKRQREKGKLLDTRCFYSMLVLNLAIPIPSPVKKYMIKIVLCFENNVGISSHRSARNFAHGIFLMAPLQLYFDSFFHDSLESSLLVTTQASVNVEFLYHKYVFPFNFLLLFY